MNPVLRSIDNLLVQFDDLSQRHATLSSDFDKTMSDFENPLRNISRSEDERRRTLENLSVETIETNEMEKSNESIDNLHKFNQHVVKSRSGHRPPSYSTIDLSTIPARSSSRSSWFTTESAPAADKLSVQKIQPLLKASISEPVTSTKTNEFPDISNKNTENISPIRRPPRRIITAFTMETVNRLSRPKIYNRPASRTVPIERTNSVARKSPTRKRKGENKTPEERRRKSSRTSQSRSSSHCTTVTTIRLTFPMQRELRPKRMIVAPAPIPVKPMKTVRTTTILTNKRTEKAPHRNMYLFR